MAVQLFLSCVSDEFGSYRDALRHDLTSLSIDVAIQEDFVALGGDTLSKLDAYIQRCDVVVHIAGNQAGAWPRDLIVTEHLARLSDLERRLPPLFAALNAGEKVSYTQWEAWLALYYSKPLLIAAPVADGGTMEPAQIAHLNWLREVGRYREVKFANKDQLVARITKSLFEILPRTIPTARQPRNLPFASLGSLFMGRDQALDDLRVALMDAKGVAVAGRALHGLGGIGKTRLAIEYALGHEADYSALLFVRADDPATLNANLAALAGAEVLDLPEKEAREDEPKIQAALRWLADHPT